MTMTMTMTVSMSMSMNMNTIIITTNITTKEWSRVREHHCFLFPSHHMNGETTRKRLYYLCALQRRTT